MHATGLTYDTGKGYRSLDTEHPKTREWNMVYPERPCHDLRPLYVLHPLCGVSLHVVTHSPLAR
jgi:hypothetical protein